MKKYLNHNKGSSVSFPNLSNSQQAAINELIYQQQQKAAAKEQHINKPFGHIADVEEENEALLESELKTAAQINDAVSKSLMTTTGSTPSGEVDDEEMETSTTTTGAVEAATYNSEEEIGVDESEPAPQSQHQAAPQQQHLPRAHSHMPYYPPGVDPVAAAAAFQIAYLQQQIQQQQQAANYINQMSTDYNNNSTEEMQRRQQKFSTNRGGSLSYFSDPYLLRSLQVASISSNANLHPSQQAVANYFRENHHLHAAAAAAAAAAASSASSASHANNTGNDTSGYINIYF